MEKQPKANAEAKSENEIYTQRFYFLMRLIRIGKMLRGAKIIPAGK